MIRYKRKYIVEAWDRENPLDFTHIHIAEATVFAVSETLAIAKAKELMSRQNYAILKVEMIEC